jgi:Ser/Thr protein kinase RdoA (MazF antagonist)
LLRHEYGARAPRLTPFYEEPDKAIYRVDHAGGAPWVLRHYPAARPLERLRGQAAIMRHVAHNGIPAEQIIPTVTGTDSTVLAGRGLLVTSLLEGTRPRPTSPVLRRLGESIGRLHALPPEPSGNRSLTRRAGAMPREDLAFGRACLDRVEARVPAEHRAAYDALRATLKSTRDCEDLPPAAHGLLHSDCHLANAVETVDGGVAWFDWDGAGQGPRIAALGLLLYSCAVQAPDEKRDPGAPTDPSVIAERVEAVLSGYLVYHRLTAAERDYLPDAIRFRPAVIAARALASAFDRGVPPDGTGWWARYPEAEVVATCARRTIERSGYLPE